MGGEYGVKNINEMVEFGHAIGEGVDNSFADGKFDLADAMNIMGPLQKAPAAFGDLDVMLKELGEVDEEDHAAVMAKIREADYDEDLAEVIYEESLALGLSAARIASAVREHKRRKAEAEAPASE